MGLFTKKQAWRSVVEYYKIEDKLYKFHRGKYIGKGDKELTPTEFFNAYGLDVCEFDIAEGDFARWDATYYFSLNDDDFPYDMSKAELVDKDDLEDAISQLESDFQKKFDEFPLDGTLYSHIGVPDYNECFNPVVKVKKKIIDSTTNDVSRSLILEVEELDGLSATTKYKFIPFNRFIKEYKPGHNMKVVASVETPQGFDPGVFESYFDEWYMY